MYKSKIHIFIIFEVLIILISMGCVFAGFHEITAAIGCAVLTVVNMAAAGLYMKRSNKYLKANYPDLFLKHKNAVYNPSGRLLSFEIYLSIKKGKLKAEKSGELYKTAKEGFVFVVFEGLCVLACFICLCRLTVL